MPVVRTGDLDRILGLCRRTKDPTEQLDERCFLSTDAYESGACALRSAQLKALSEAARCRGLVAALSVGTGKTLLSFLIPTAVGALSPVLLVPSQLVDKTNRELAAYRAEGWNIRPLRVVAYELLSRRPELLDGADCIIADEAHRLKRMQSARTKRVIRHLRQNTCTFYALSASLLQGSIADMAHIYEMALRDRSPLSTNHGDLADWCAAVDEGVTHPIGTGALRHLVDGAPLTKVEARQAIRDWLRDTPGVIISDNDRPACALTINVRGGPKTVDLWTALDRLDQDWELPDGTEVDTPQETWRHTMTLALGFYQVYDPAPPLDWSEAKADWGRALRRLVQNREGMDSPSLVEQRIKDGKTKCPEYWSWKEIEPTYEPTHRVEWITKSVLREHARWAMANDAVLWYRWAPVGEALHEFLPVYGAGDQGILDARGPCAAAIGAHGEGKNLQQWSKARVLTPPSSAKVWEQLIGRHHRSGQLEDVVEFQVFAPTEVHRKSLTRARDRARFIGQTTGDIQRLDYADWV